MAGSATGRLNLTSGKSSGYKVFFAEPLVIENDAEILVLDFDLAQSIKGHAAGKSGQFILNPHFRVSSVTLAGASPGSASTERVSAASSPPARRARSSSAAPRGSSGA